MGQSAPHPPLKMKLYGLVTPFGVFLMHYLKKLFDLFWLHTEWYSKKVTDIYIFFSFTFVVTNATHSSTPLAQVR